MASQNKCFIHRIGPSDDLTAVINGIVASWPDDYNELTAESLRRFVGNASNFFVIAMADNQVAGTAVAYRLTAPDGSSQLYIDEVDTAGNFRRQGVATAVMRYLAQAATEEAINEVWLAAEQGNQPAVQLYNKLQPGKSVSSVVFNFNTTDLSRPT